jgi:hypothetical protein
MLELEMVGDLKKLEQRVPDEQERQEQPEPRQHV